MDSGRFIGPLSIPYKQPYACRQHGHGIVLAVLIVTREVNRKGVRVNECAHVYVRICVAMCTNWCGQTTLFAEASTGVQVNDGDHEHARQ